MILPAALLAPGHARAQQVSPPELYAVWSSLPLVREGDELVFGYAANSEIGLGTVAAFFVAQYGAGIYLRADLPESGQIRIPIRAGLLDGSYMLHSVFLEDTQEFGGWAEYNRDGSLRTSSGSGPATHGVQLDRADFTVTGNGIQDVIAPSLTDIRRDGGGSYRYSAIDDGAGVVSVSVNIREPDGGATQATTRSPGNTGMASLRLMSGAPTGRYVVESVHLRDGATPPNEITYHRDYTVTSTDPNAPQWHYFPLDWLDFMFGVPGADTTAPELVSIIGTGGGSFQYVAQDDASGVVSVSADIELPDGSMVTAGTRAPGESGGFALRLMPGAPNGRHIVRSVMVRDGADPVNWVRYLRNGETVSTDPMAPRSHEFDLAELDFVYDIIAPQLEMIRIDATRLSVGDTPTFRYEASDVGTGIGQVRVRLTRPDGQMMEASSRAPGETGLIAIPLMAGALQGRYRVQGVFLADQAGTPGNWIEYLRDGTVDSFAYMAPREHDFDLAALDFTYGAVGAAEFVGGGSVFAFSPECAVAFPDSVAPARLRYVPSELNRLPSEVSIFWPDGSDHLALWGPMTQSSGFLGAAGRQAWTRFVFYPARPLMRVVQRRITLPENATDLGLADELVLRIRVQNFGSITGCAATVAASLRRVG